MTLIDTIRNQTNRTAKEHRRGHDRWFKIQEPRPIPIAANKYDSSFSRFNNNYDSWNEKYLQDTVYHTQDLKALRTGVEQKAIEETKQLPAVIADEEFMV